MMIIIITTLFITTRPGTRTRSIIFIITYLLIFREFKDVVFEDVVFDNDSLPKLTIGFTTTDGDKTINIKHHILKHIPERPNNNNTGHYGQVVVVQVVIAKLCFSHFLATSLWS